MKITEICFTPAKCQILNLQGDTFEGSLPVELTTKKLIPGDALNPERLEFPNVADALKENGLALPKRRYIISVTPLLEVMK